MLLEQGAHYPWETAPSDGHDAAVAPTDWSEQHISLDVALGTIATARALNDSEFNRETAFPVVSNVAGACVAKRNHCSLICVYKTFQFATQDLLLAQTGWRDVGNRTPVDSLELCTGIHAATFLHHHRNLGYAPQFWALYDYLKVTGERVCRLYCLE